MNHNFIEQPLLTYLGNKRKQINQITELCQELLSGLGKTKGVFLDAFCGSGVVSRALLHYASKLDSVDVEHYATIVTYACIKPPHSETDKQILQKHFDNMNQLVQIGPYVDGFICTHYAPKNTKNIKKGERCFFTRENALIIDTLNNYIQNKVEKHLQVYCIAALLVQCSIHSNTSGQFRSFYKNKQSNIGQFGGTNQIDLKRICGQIQPVLPIWLENCSKNVSCVQSDIFEFLKHTNKVYDIIYLDPPYDHNPYASNYFLLNLIAKNQQSVDNLHISKVVGIPKKWRRSVFNRKRKAFQAMQTLLQMCVCRSTYTVISYSEEGLLTSNDWDTLFKPYKIIRQIKIRSKVYGMKAKYRKQQGLYETISVLCNYSFF